MVIGELKRQNKQRSNSMNKKGQLNESFEMEVINKDVTSETRTSDSVKRIDVSNNNRKRRTKTGSRSNNLSNSYSTSRTEQQANTSCMLCIIVHRSDRLRRNLFGRHVAVRIYVMDSENKNFMQSLSYRDDCAEQEHFVSPLTTKTTYVKCQELFVPIWEEIIIFPMKLQEILENDKTVLLFEILDVPKKQIEREISSTHLTFDEYIPVAWSFLKPVGANGHKNTGMHKQRLQLFEPFPSWDVPAEFKSTSSGKSSTTKTNNQQHIPMSILGENSSESIKAGLHLISWWSAGQNKRIPYPSTLYVTVKGINLESMNGSAGMIGNKLRPSLGIFSLDESTMRDHKPTSRKSSITSESDIKRKIWRRKPEQPCQIPNYLVGLGFNRSRLTKDHSDWNVDCHSKSYGAHCLTFSPNGKWLAVGIIGQKSETSSSISIKPVSLDCRVLIYEYPFNLNQSQPKIELRGHTGIIYSICWSPKPMKILNKINNNMDSSQTDIKCWNKFWLLSASSADGTVRVWWLSPGYLKKQVKETAFAHKQSNSGWSETGFVDEKSLSNGSVKVGQVIQGDWQHRELLCTVLGHPNFVYSVTFKPVPQSESEETSVASHLLATACYDRSIRLWLIRKCCAELIQELSGPHSTHINCLCFNPRGYQLYSGDANGLIAIWQNRPSGNNKNDTPRNSIYVFEKTFEDPELQDCIINHLEVHPKYELLLVHSRDNTPKMIDLRSYFILTRFHGSINNREFLRSCISPCGTFLFSGSEDGCVYVWNVITGDQVACYKNLNLPGFVTSLSFHPEDNVIAMSALGPDAPVVIYAYDPKVNSIELGNFPATRQTADAPRHLIEKEYLNKIINKSERINSKTMMQVMSKLNSVLNQRREPVSEEEILHKLEWRPKFTVVDDALPCRGVADGASRNSDTIEHNLFEQKTMNRKVSKSDDHVVTALYDYQAQRSDELTLHCGDRLEILYKDTPQWWMAKLLSTGQEGFVLSNYVSGPVLGSSKIRDLRWSKSDGGVTKAENKKKIPQSYSFSSNSNATLNFQSSINSQEISPGNKYAHTKLKSSNQSYENQNSELEMHAKSSIPSLMSDSDQVDQNRKILSAQIKSNGRRSRPLPEGHSGELRENFPAESDPTRKTNSMNSQSSSKLGSVSLKPFRRNSRPLPI